MRCYCGTSVETIAEYKDHRRGACSRPVPRRKGPPMPEAVKDLLRAPYHNKWIPIAGGGEKLVVVENPSRVRAREKKMADRRAKVMAKAMRKSGGTIRRKGR